MVHRTRGSALASSRLGGFAAVLTLVAAVLSVTNGVQALAEDYDQFFKRCYDGGNPDQTIVACSALITKGLSDHIDLATAFKNRAKVPSRTWLELGEARSRVT